MTEPTTPQPEPEPSDAASEALRRWEAAAEAAGEVPADASTAGDPGAGLEPDAVGDVRALEAAAGAAVAVPPAPPVGFFPRGTGPGVTPLPIRALRLSTVALAGFGAFLGVLTLWYHLTSDPLSDSRAYYEAARRLNEGLTLYPPGADPNQPDFYRYPPLLAIILRPVALLSYEQFAALWEAGMVAALVLTVKRIGLGFWTWIALGLLGIPLGWALAIGQAQILVTFLLVLGTPLSLALAAHIKVFPILAALYWIGRGEVGYVTGFLGWLVGLSVVQAVLDPAGWADFWKVSTFDEVGMVNNLSPFASSPTLWLALLVIGIVAALLTARTRFGWWVAVTLSSLASPRLLLYMVSTLLAGLREPEPDSPDVPPPPDAAEVYVRSAR